MSAGHTLRATIGPQPCVLDLAVVCHEPEGAACRLTCTKECDSWGPDHEHDLTDGGECNIELWINANNSVESYAGDQQAPIHDGMPIEAFFDTDHYKWRAAPAPTGAGP